MTKDESIAQLKAMVAQLKQEMETLSKQARRYQEERDAALQSNRELLTELEQCRGDDNQQDVALQQLLAERDMHKKRADQLEANMQTMVDARLDELYEQDGEYARVVDERDEAQRKVAGLEERNQNQMAAIVRLQEQLAEQSDAAQLVHENAELQRKLQQGTQSYIELNQYYLERLAQRSAAEIADHQIAKLMDIGYVSGLWGAYEAVVAMKQDALEDDPCDVEEALERLKKDVAMMIIKHGRSSIQ